MNSLIITVVALLILYGTCWCWTFIGGVVLGDFILDKGWWKLVPFRVSGWKSIVEPGKIYRVQWIGERLDFTDFYYEKENSKQS